MWKILAIVSLSQTLTDHASIFAGLCSERWNLPALMVFVFAIMAFDDMNGAYLQCTNEDDVKKLAITLITQTLTEHE